MLQVQMRQETIEAPCRCTARHDIQAAVCRRFRIIRTRSNRLASAQPGKAQAATMTRPSPCRPQALLQSLPDTSNEVRVLHPCTDQADWPLHSQARCPGRMMPQWQVGQDKIKHPASAGLDAQAAVCCSNRLDRTGYTDLASATARLDTDTATRLGGRAEWTGHAQVTYAL